MQLKTRLKSVTLMVSSKLTANLISKILVPFERLHLIFYHICGFPVTIPKWTFAYFCSHIVCGLLYNCEWCIEGKVCRYTDRSINVTKSTAGVKFMISLWGIQWTMFSYLEDVNRTDNVTFLFHTSAGLVLNILKCCDTFKSLMAILCGITIFLIYI